MTTPAIVAAALAGVPAGVQSQGIWMGRRQLFVKFAAEAETATMYTADALTRDLQRQTKRAVFHSISVTGRDPLANKDFLLAALSKNAMTVPVMLDIDGQRPDETEALAPHVALVQVTIDPASGEGMLERGLETLRIAARAQRACAFVAAASAETSDAQILRTIETIRDAGATLEIVLLPPFSTDASLDRRWAVLLDRAMQLHPRTALGARILPPAGMR